MGHQDNTVPETFNPTPASEEIPDRGLPPLSFISVIAAAGDLTSIQPDGPPCSIALTPAPPRMKLTADTSIRYVIKIEDRLGGPYSVEGLESLVYLKKINPETLIAREGTDTFVPIRQSEVCGALFKHLTRTATPREWAPPSQENNPEFVNRKRYRLGEAKFETVNEVAARRKIDVYDMLGEVRQAEKDAGRDRPRSSRFKVSNRTKDFWIMVIAGNAAILGGGIYMQNTASIVFAIAGCGLFTFGLLWSMFGVMGKY
ncbi:MAG TPA: hypothetical protein VHS96_12530 [Bacteroidia bacterium]|nr:hypothetical protein [Bacteroidia bacterium]